MRTDDDSWSISDSVGSTALMVAAVRAAESNRSVPLINDPYARMLVDDEGGGVFSSILDGSLADRIAATDPDAAALLSYMQDYQAVRTRFFDTFFTEAAAAGIRQFVILASGLDTRAYRLDWPAGTVVYEVDLPKVLTYKASELAAHGVQPRATVREVAVDLRDDWPSALVEQGFDLSEPAAWLAEGLLMYLPSSEQDELFELITESSAVGSRVAAEFVPYSDDEVRAQIKERFTVLADELGVEPIVFGFVADMDDLTYLDPERTNPAVWLEDNGWRASAVPVTEEMRQYGIAGDESMRGRTDSFAYFVTGSCTVRTPARKPPGSRDRKPA
jgi:methyltransferase (TIGR00027 family)